MTASDPAPGPQAARLQALAGRRVLVTGADGFIGSHLTEALVRAGADVRAMCVYNSLGSHGWLDRAEQSVQDAIEFVLGDVRDPFLVAGAFEGRELVFHLAALIAIPYSYVAPHAYVETNVGGTTNVVQACRDKGVARCVVTSPSEVYGTARFVPITEEHPLQGQSPYSASKIGADMIALSYHKAFGTPVSVIRPFNTYGPRQSARAVLPTIIAQLASGARQIMLGDLTPTRDFNFVADTVAGFLAVAGADAAIGTVTNIASNFEISIGEAARTIIEVMGRDAEVVRDEARVRPPASEVERLWGANDRARELTGWTPSYGGLDGFRRGIAETVEWFGDPANLAAYRPARYAI